MLNEHCYQLLRIAAIEPLERIQLDRAEAPERLKPLLAYIEEHLFDPSLNVNHLKRACNVRDNSLPIHFHSAVGRAPRRYIEDRRLETACRLLAATDLKIWQISELVGFSSLPVFSRAFTRSTGQRPTAFRKQARERSDGGRIHSFSDDERQLSDPESLRRALAGELAASEASVLIERLQGLYPSHRRYPQRMEALGPAPVPTNGPG